MGRLLVSLLPRTSADRRQITQAAMDVVNAAADELVRMRDDPRLNAEQRAEFKLFDERITDLLAQIDELGETKGIWPKMIFLNTKVDKLQRAADKFAHDVRLSSTRVIAQMAKSTHSSSSSTAEDEDPDTKTPTIASFPPLPKARPVGVTIPSNAMLFQEVLEQTTGKMASVSLQDDDTISQLGREDIVDATGRYHRDPFDTVGQLPQTVDVTSMWSAANIPEASSPVVPSLYSLLSSNHSVHSFGGTDHSDGYSLPIKPEDMPKMGAIYFDEGVAWLKGYQGD